MQGCYNYLVTIRIKSKRESRFYQLGIKILDYFLGKKHQR